MAGDGGMSCRLDSIWGFLRDIELGQARLAALVPVDWL